MLESPLFYFNIQIFDNVTVTKFKNKKFEEFIRKYVTKFSNNIILLF